MRKAWKNQIRIEWINWRWIVKRNWESNKIICKNKGEAVDIWIDIAKQIKWELFVKTKTWNVSCIKSYITWQRIF
jgi:hypothetical protein